MILSKLFLPTRAKQRWKYTKPDDPKHCYDKEHFKSYPYGVDYVHNSRGFRDGEWPESIKDLKNSIWCIGDSFTVGLGSPYKHIWPQQLGLLTNTRTINVSMDGASNQWIARMTEYIVNEIDPAHIVIMWSYTSRRELNNDLLTDEQRRFPVDPTRIATAEDDWNNFLDCKQRVNNITSALHFTIPGFHKTKFVNTSSCWNDIKGQTWPLEPKTVDELHSLPPQILDEIKNIHRCFEILEESLSRDFIVVEQLDKARDGLHFDLLTAKWVASRAASCLNL